MMDNRPKIGVGVLVFKNGKILLCQRKGAHGEGTWAPPGGHLEFGETVLECAYREVLEETGLNITGLQPGPYTEDIFMEEKKHYITLWIISEWAKGDAAIMEPEKCRSVEWFDLQDLPNPLFLPFANLTRNYLISDLKKTLSE